MNAQSTEGGRSVERRAGPRGEQASSAGAGGASMNAAVAEWHRIVREHDAGALPKLLADDVVFHSPVVHAPQRGRAAATRILAAAVQVFGNPTFRYVRELHAANEAVLEFLVDIEGIEVNGVDMIRCDDGGRIVEFKVMLRPLKAINLIHQKMGALLQSSG